MDAVTKSKKRKLQEADEQQELIVDRISLLPDDVLGDIVTLLPTRAGARTQVLSSRWRHIWRSAPLNLDLTKPLRRTPAGAISGVLAAHPGPGRRFSIDYSSLCNYSPGCTTTLDGWLRSPGLDNLQELKILFNYDHLRRGIPPLQLPPSVLHFSSTLTIASFRSCVFPDCGNMHNAATTHWPVLKKLTLSMVTVSDNSLQALLAGCSVLESLLLQDNRGLSRVRIVSPSLMSIGVNPGRRRGNEDDRPWLLLLQQIVIEDAPCLERLLFFKGQDIDISIISAPRMKILGELRNKHHVLNSSQ
ncbi:unnamed protein product [Urochloa humidicola]